MVGWGFTLLNPATVTHVGWYDDGLDGLSRDWDVGLWHDGQELFDDRFHALGITIPGGQATSLLGVWRVVELPTPLTLAPGFYVLGGADTSDSMDVIVYDLLANHTKDPAVTGGRVELGTFFYGKMGPQFGVLIEPTQFYAVDGIELGPMLFVSVPEPTGLPLASFWILGFVLRRRLIRHRGRCTVAAGILAAVELIRPAGSRSLDEPPLHAVNWRIPR